MIGQYLSNTNEKSTVSILQNILEQQRATVGTLPLLTLRFYYRLCTYKYELRRSRTPFFIKKEYYKRRSYTISTPQYALVNSKPCTYSYLLIIEKTPKLVHLHFEESINSNFEKYYESTRFKKIIINIYILK